MTLDDLLTLLREEFVLDVPSTQDAMMAAAMDPPSAATELEPMLGFIDRSIQASALVGLHGWGGYLQQIAEFTSLQRNAPDADSLGWLMGWLEPALQYLQEPAQTHSAQHIVDFLRACPATPDESVLTLLQEMLLMPPALSLEEAAAANAPLEAAQPEDVSLVTEDLDLGLLSAMLADAPEQLEQLYAHLERLEAGQANAAQMVEAQRIAHTFKGSGNIIGLPGIGRVAHRLEDVMEWALECVEKGKPVNPAAIRDMQYSVSILQQMVAHLQGEESAPEGALDSLQRLLDWVGWIRDDSVDTQAPPPLAATIATSFASSVATNLGASNADDAKLSSQITAPAANADVQTLRVGVDRLSRILRRAGQSIVTSQRLGQLMRDAESRLAAMELHHIELGRRLRELEQTVDKQVVQLREQRESGEGFDPLEMDRYDALHGLSRFVTEAVQDELEMSREARSHANRALQIGRASCRERV